MNFKSTDSEIAILRQQATILAGRTGDLAQRAAVYHHLYSHSGGNHCFPLLAAHGALWASGYFKRGIRFGRFVASARGLIGHDSLQLVASLEKFAEDFRDINRRVCIETFFIYWLTENPDFRDQAENLIPHDLLESMAVCHHHRAKGIMMDNSQRRKLFTAFFLWEQANIVGPAINLAFSEFNWPLIKFLALRPRIAFSYFRHSMPFSDFNDMEERVAKGMDAFDEGVVCGWENVENHLGSYGIMPQTFVSNSRRHFDHLVHDLIPNWRPLVAFN